MNAMTGSSPQPTADEIRALDWARLHSDADSASCEHLHRALMRWLQSDELGQSHREVWLAIEPVLGLFINPDLDHEDPFMPPGAIVPDDVVGALFEAQQDGWSADLRARCWDLAWTKRLWDYSAVATAVKAYLESADSPGAAWPHVYTRLKRSVEVGATIGRAQQPFHDAILAVEAVLDAVEPDDTTLLPHRLLELLVHYREGENARNAKLAHDLAEAARARYERDGVQQGLECERERAYLEVEIKLRRRAGDNAAAQALQTELAEAYKRQADGVIAAKWPSCKQVAVHFTGCAIECYRRVGGYEDRLADLRFEHEALQREATSEMGRVSFSVDATQAVKAARAVVEGKRPVEALVALVTGYAPPTLEDLREEAVKMDGRSPFAAMVPASYTGPRGTVLAHHAGAVRPDDDTGLQLETMRVAHARQGGIATMTLHPAAEQIRYEHGLGIAFFLQLARWSGFVPTGREMSFARGLAAGLRGDYDLAATLLFPQFEHAIREDFFRRGIVTRSLPGSGVQNEYDLNKLFAEPRAEDVFGTELLFDLQVLLTEKAGGNLRNDLAHGLVADGEKTGAKIYFWWTCLFFVMFPLLVQDHQTIDASEPGADSENK